MAKPVMLELVRQFLHHEPFAPFSVVLRSGKRVQINDPEKVAIGGAKVFVFLPPQDRMMELPEADIELVFLPRRRG